MHGTTPSTAPGRIVVRAPAKINLTLDVLGRRPDGYHALRSVMQTLELHDTLELCPAAAIRFACEAPALAGEDNLVPRAAHLLRTTTGYGGGVDITLRKRIPVDAGLGVHRDEYPGDRGETANEWRINAADVADLSNHK